MYFEHCMTCWHKIDDAPFLVSAESCEAQIRFMEPLAEFLVYFKLRVQRDSVWARIRSKNNFVS